MSRFLDDFQGFSDRDCFRHFANRSGPLSSKKDVLFPPSLLYIQVLSQNPAERLARRGPQNSGEVFSWMLRHRPSFLQFQQTKELHYSPLDLNQVERN